MPRLGGMIVLAPSSADLSLAVRLAAIPVIMSAAELLLRREALGTGGFLDFEILGLLKGSIASHNTTMARLFRLSMRRGPYVGVLVAQLLSAAALVAVPRSVPLVAVTTGLYVLMTKRNHLSNDGSDDMVVVVLVASALAMLGSSAFVREAWAVFLTGQLLLAYFVSGISKAQSDVWWRGDATTAVLRTRHFRASSIRPAPDPTPNSGRTSHPPDLYFRGVGASGTLCAAADFSLGFGCGPCVPPRLRRGHGPKYVRLGFRRLLSCRSVVVAVARRDDITSGEVSARPSLGGLRRDAAGVVVEPAPGGAGHGKGRTAPVAAHRHADKRAPGGSQPAPAEGLRPLNSGSRGPTTCPDQRYVFPTPPRATMTAHGEQRLTERHNRASGYRWATGPARAESSYPYRAADQGLPRRRLARSRPARP